MSKRDRDQGETILGVLFAQTTLYFLFWVVGRIEDSFRDGDWTNVLIRISSGAFLVVFFGYASFACFGWAYYPEEDFNTNDLTR